MPGRYSITKDKEDIEKRFGASAPQEYNRRFNISPTQKVPIILNTKPKEIVMAKWGYELKWLKSPLINCRSEDIEENKVFAKSFRERRCLIIADSYYEWEHTETEGKIPYRIMLKDESIFAMAGVWIEIEDELHIAAITCAPNKLIEPIHSRMPAILKKEDEKKWLEEPDSSLLKPYNPDDMKMIRISKEINSSKHDNEDLIKPEERQKGLDEF
jgi:putative SOS response-associated peptidase YedK